MALSRLGTGVCSMDFVQGFPRVRDLATAKNLFTAINGYDVDSTLAVANPNDYGKKLLLAILLSKSQAGSIAMLEEKDFVEVGRYFGNSNEDCVLMAKGLRRASAPRKEGRVSPIKARRKV